MTAIHIASALETIDGITELAIVAVTDDYRLAGRLVTGFWDSGEVTIHEFHVAPEYRGRGIGKSLLRELVRCAGENGAELLTVSVDRDNEAGQAAYRSVGFEERGPAADEWRGDDEWISLRMALQPAAFVF